ncbi:MAG: prepilin peptidase [Opitutales bacterium]|nr:prepilin peptidase [Opitutales bacterium]
MIGGGEVFWQSPLCGMLAFILGACLGSFFDLCIMRIPKNQSVIWPRSCCECGQPIPFYLNLPILGWLILRGRARCCGRRLERQYLFVELLTALLFTRLWVLYRPMEFCIYGLFLGLLIIASGIDFTTMMIPDRCSVGGAILGIFGSAILAHYAYGNYIFLGIFESLKGMLLGSGVLLWIAILSELILKKETVGFGDIKLMGCIGAFLETNGAIFAIFGGATLGLVTIFPIWWWIHRTQKIRTGSILPFGPFLSLGAMVYLLGLRPFVDEYFAQLELLLR